jgi:hypothetical protein
LKDANDWMEQYRTFWEESFDRLEIYLKSVTDKNKKMKKKEKKNVRKK